VYVGMTRARKTLTLRGRCTGEFWETSSRCGLAAFAVLAEITE